MGGVGISVNPGGIGEGGTSPKGVVGVSGYTSAGGLIFPGGGGKGRSCVGGGPGVGGNTLCP